jgi:uncharacterized protein YuzE
MEEDTRLMMAGVCRWTYDAQAFAWYFTLNNQIGVAHDSIFTEARVDLDRDGRVMGIELMDPRLLPPKAPPEAK